MADLTITSSGAPGWRELRIGHLQGLLPQDLPPAVAEAVEVLESSEEPSSLEDLLDALVASGIRRAPDAVLAEGRRVVVRGGCTVRLGEGDEAGTLAHDGRGPWVDVDVPPDVTDVELRAPGVTTSATGETEGLRLVAEWQPPSVLGEVAVTRVPGPSRAPGPAAPQDGPESGAVQQPAEDVSEVPPPTGEAATPAAAAPEAVPSAPEGRLPAPARNPEDTGVPDYDFLFGDTQAARPGAPGPAGEDPAAAPLTPDEVDAAAGVTRGGDHGDATILPSDETEPERSDEAPAGAPTAGGLVPEPVPTPGPVRGGLISSVPWARSGAGPEASLPEPPPPVPSVQPERPAPPAPPSGGTPPSPVSTEQAPSEEPADVTRGRDALIAQAASVDGPKVLAVICPAGHLSPPHRDTCRVCSRQVADQQAFEAARPALGVLRLESGDKVPLDRGVLLGRSPKAKADLEVARQPHVVKLPSPDNDLSRNHLEIVIDGWHVLARDLGSTNGTTVQLPGAAPTRLRPDEHVALEPGAVLVLADVVSVTFEVGP